MVTAGIVMLLAGVGIMGATQDALTGFPVTASARMLDALLNTAGIIAGVSAGLTVGALFGVGPTNFQPGASGLAEAGVTVVGAALAAAAFAFASYAPLRSLAAVGIVGGLGQAVQLAVNSAELGRTWGSAAAAVTIGAVCYLVAGFSASRRSSWWCQRSCRCCRDWTSTEGSPSMPKARTGCSSWRLRRPQRSHWLPA